MLTEPNGHSYSYNGNTENDIHTNNPHSVHHREIYVCYKNYVEDDDDDDRIWNEHLVRLIMFR